MGGENAGGFVRTGAYRYRGGAGAVTDVLGVEDSGITANGVVTNTKWVVQDYFVDTSASAGDNIFRATAYKGDAEFEQRYLLIYPQLLSELLGQGFKHVWFEMEAVSVRISVDALVGAAFQDVLAKNDFNSGNVLYVLSIKPDPDGLPVGAENKTYTTELFIRDTSPQQGSEELEKLVSVTDVVNPKVFARGTPAETLSASN